MDVAALITIVIAIAGMVGGYFQGKRTALSSAVTTATEVVSLLEARVGLLERQLQEKDSKITEMCGRVEVLQDLVTQRADVEAVRGVVLRIADRIGA